MLAETRRDTGVDELARSAPGGKPLSKAGAAHADPGDVALTGVLDAFGHVQK